MGLLINIYSASTWLIGIIVLLFLSAIVIGRNHTSSRLFFSRILIVSMFALMFANIFIAEATLGILARLAVFGTFLLAGTLFVRTTLQEERTREDLANLTDRMEEMNANLESLVHTRTKEIKHARIHTDTIIEQLTHGLLEITPDGRLLRMNEAAETLTGVSRNVALKNAVIPPPLTQLMYPYTKTRNESELPPSPSLPRGADVREITLQGPQARQIQTTTIPIKNGTKKTFVRLLRDITRHKRISRSKTEFISVAAHQLRTPLAGIKWTLNLLIDGELGRLSANARTQLIHANQSNELLLQLIGDLLLVSRIETGKEDYSMANVSLTALIQKTLETLTSFGNEEKIEITSTMPKTPIHIMADERLFGRALFSLIDNAIRYNTEGGSVKISLTKKDATITIDIHDTGIGIPPQEREHLFSKFYRSEASIKRHTEGAGLALFITKHIIVRHGGTLTINPAPTGGTIATITLPAL